MKRISAILLAAGPSSRLGQPKQLLAFNNTTLLNHSISAAVRSKCSNTIVVLGSNATKLEDSIDTNYVEIAVNPNWALGMGNSLKFGLSQVVTIDPAVTAVIIMVCDQPLISSEHLDKLIATYTASGKKIVASAYHCLAGVPVLFDKILFDQLLNLSDTKGAKSLIESNPDDVALVDFPGGEIDIDTAEDYQKLS